MWNARLPLQVGPAITVRDRFGSVHPTIGYF